MSKSYRPNVGDRVKDVWGNEGVVIKVDPKAQQGLGVVTVRYYDGRVVSSALIAHDYERSDTQRHDLPESS
jgi:hypothetical protein